MLTTNRIIISIGLYIDRCCVTKVCISLFVCEDTIGVFFWYWKLLLVLKSKVFLAYNRRGGKPTLGAIQLHVYDLSRTGKDP